MADKEIWGDEEIDWGEIDKKRIGDRDFHYRQFLSGKIEINNNVFNNFCEDLNQMLEKLYLVPLVHAYFCAKYSIDIVADTIAKKENITVS